MGLQGILMIKVIIRGPLLSLSGYGTHSRQIFRWLLNRADINLKVQILPWGMTPWLIDPDAEDGIVGEIMARSSVEPNDRFDVSFQIQLPNEWDTNLAKFNVGVSAFVETDRCSPEWIDNCNSMQHIVVPSTFVKEVIENTGTVTAPISVVHESFYDALLEPEPKVNLDLGLKTDFNFLIFGQVTGQNPWTDRKNTFYMIKWLCEQFKNDADVGIVIKTNQGTNSSIDRKHTSTLLTKLIKEVRKGKYPKIYLLHGRLEHEEIHSVYKNEKIKALVAATRGEGFGLPMLEAAASSLPIIATNWSGHLDFLNEGKFIKLDYNLEKIHKEKVDGKIFVEGSKWAEVKEEDFKRKASKFRKSHKVPKIWADELGVRVRENFSFKAVSSSYDKLFAGVIG